MFFATAHYLEFPINTNILRLKNLGLRSSPGKVKIIVMILSMNY